MAMVTVRDFSLKFSRHHNPANLCHTESHKSSKKMRDTVGRHTNSPILRTTAIQFCGLSISINIRKITPA